MILEITKQRAIMITMRIVWVFDVKKVKKELPGPYVKVGPPQADKDSNYPPEIFHRSVFLAENFDWNTL